MTEKTTIGVQRLWVSGALEEWRDVPGAQLKAERGLEAARAIAWEYRRSDPGVTVRVVERSVTERVTVLLTPDQK
ncbi:MAG: hypothetical protein AAGI68_16110 [Planctomycetota bacterium]